MKIYFYGVVSVIPKVDIEILSRYIYINDMPQILSLLLQMPNIRIRKSDVPPEMEEKIVKKVNEALEKLQIEKVRNNLF